MNTQTSTRNYRIFLLPAITALLMNLVIGPLAPVFQQGGTDVFGAMEFTNDEQGANDQPGQKDLTRLGIDYAGLPTSVHVIFNLDDIEWSGKTAAMAVRCSIPMTTSTSTSPCAQRSRAARLLW